MTIKKIRIGVLAAMFMFMTVGIIMEEEGGQRIYTLDRPSYFEGSREYQLIYDYGGLQAMPFNLQVDQKSATEEEKSDEMDQVSEEIRTLLESYFSHEITGRLILPKEMESCVIQWEIEPRWIMNEDGWLIVDKLSKKNMIKISYKIQFNDESMVAVSERFSHTFGRESISDEYIRKYSQYVLKQYSNNLHPDDSPNIQLPEGFEFYIKEEKSAWSKMTTAIMLATGIFTVGFIKEKKQRRDRKKKQLKIWFVYFLGDFLMLIKAGLISSRAFETALENNASSSLLVDEFNKYAKNGLMMMKNQTIMETVTYLSIKFNLPEFSRYSRILIENQRYGDGQLIYQLQQMKDDLWKERLNKAKKDGEVASTKLVMPMFVLFIVILILTIGSAFIEANQYV